MIVWDRYLLGAYVGTTQSSEPPAGRRALRFPTTTANLGTGPLDLRGGTINGSTQEVNQRIYRSDGTFWTRPAGQFVYHPTHGHIHFEDWTLFRLRQYLPGGGVGSTLRVGEKTSFCIIETTVYDSTLPGYNNSAWGPYSCGQTQGQRPGRADTYGATLSGQYIDIEGIPDGQYWLEGEVDPNNNVLELNETNNITRVLVTIGNVPAAQPDAYEDNDTKAITDARTEGAANSPNLGLVNTRRTISDLSMDDAEDWYKFRLHGTATAGDYVRIESGYQSGQNMYFYLLNSAGTVISSDTSSVAFKQLSLSGLGPGTFYLRVVRNTGANPNYLLTIEPDGNLPPTITVTGPPAGEIYVEHAHDTIPITWTTTDPEGDPKTVAVFIDRDPAVGPNNLALDGYQDLQGSDHEVNVNTAIVGLGPWYVILRASDGGAYGYGISPGTVVVFERGDLNFNGIVDSNDVRVAGKALRQGTVTPRIRNICDMDEDGDFDKHDVAMMEEMMQ